MLLTSSNGARGSAPPAYPASTHAWSVILGRRHRVGHGADDPVIRRGLLHRGHVGPCPGYLIPIRRDGPSLVGARLHRGPGVPHRYLPTSPQRPAPRFARLRPSGPRSFHSPAGFRPVRGLTPRAEACFVSTVRRRPARALRCGDDRGRAVATSSVVGMKPEAGWSIPRRVKRIRFRQSRHGQGVLQSGSVDETVTLDVSRPWGEANRRFHGTTFCGPRGSAGWPVSAISPRKSGDAR